MKRDFYIYKALWDVSEVIKPFDNAISSYGSIHFAAQNTRHERKKHIVCEKPFFLMLR